MEISGKVYIVTGGASGLGEGTARMLAQRRRPGDDRRPAGRQGPSRRAMVRKPSCATMLSAGRADGRGQWREGTWPFGKPCMAS
jgi:NAD(P)-dependent dehydrogenase (short-subunit alcohol dehydrogenase family)